MNEYVNPGILTAALLTASGQPITTPVDSADLDLASDDQFVVSPLNETLIGWAGCLKAAAARNNRRHRRRYLAFGPERVLELIAEKQRFADSIVERVARDLSDELRVEEARASQENAGHLEPDVRQLSFPIQGSFAPSKKLTDFWVSEVMAAAEGTKLPLATVFMLSETQAQQEFASNLLSLFGVTAQQLRYEEEADRWITRSQRFTRSFSSQIGELFLIDPYKLPEFLDILYSELAAAFASGFIFSGPWGQIDLSSSGDLFYKLNPRKLRDARGFVRATVTE